MHMMPATLIAALAVVLTPAAALHAQHDVEDPPAAAESEPAFKALIFSKTAGFRHASIEDGVKAIKTLGEEHDFAVEHTEDASQFTEENLRGFDVVIFLSTTGDVLDDPQQAAFEAYIKAGGGYVGVHAAADTEYDWPWYGRLVGAYFSGHPAIQEADVIVLNSEHQSTEHLDSTWRRRDEWYNYRAQPAEGVTVLMTLDESSYEGGDMGDSHPIAWYHEFDGGRSFYTGGGHTAESFSEEPFLEHLLGGIQWAADAKRERDGDDDEDDKDDDGS